MLKISIAYIAELPRVIRAAFLSGFVIAVVIPTRLLAQALVPEALPAAQGLVETWPGDVATVR